MHAGYKKRECNFSIVHWNLIFSFYSLVHGIEEHVISL
ncbi:hypothetical protein QSI_3936 [Clostridioides difficile P28]|nr:hypothetical protein QSI_3936 [Clostridioides difficile P28]